MSVLHDPQNANDPDTSCRARRLRLAGLITASALGLGLALWPASPPPERDPPPEFTPYESADLHDQADLTPPPAPPRYTIKALEPPRLTHTSDDAAAPLDDAPPVVVVHEPNPFFPDPELADAGITPLSEPLGDDVTQTTPPFDDAISQQGVALGPSAWMAQLPDTQSAIIKDSIEETSLKVAAELDTQERERMLYDHISQLVTAAALRCASHNLSPHARIVVRVGYARLIKGKGTLSSLGATANVASGGRTMQTCLTFSLEGHLFPLPLQDTRLRHVEFTVGSR